MDDSVKKLEAWSKSGSFDPLPHEQEGSPSSADGEHLINPIEVPIKKGKRVKH